MSKHLTEALHLTPQPGERTLPEAPLGLSAHLYQWATANPPENHTDVGPEYKTEFTLRFAQCKVKHWDSEMEFIWGNVWLEGYQESNLCGSTWISPLSLSMQNYGILTVLVPQSSKRGQQTRSVCGVWE